MKVSSSRKEFKRPPLTSELTGARQKFRSLLLANPNHFGNLAKAEMKASFDLVSNTSYEEIGCVGYQPQLERLHAVVYVKQTAGYGGGICQAGTPEYVRFYLSFDDGATWADQGVSAFMAHDVPANKTRLEYAVTLNVKPPRPFCFHARLIKCRAILSWNFMPPPDDPDFQPVWGEVHNTNIAVEPRKIIIFKDLIDEVKIKLPPEALQVLDTAQEIKVADHAQHTAMELSELYRGKDVEPHRFAFKELHQFIMNDTGALSAAAKGPLQSLDIDWSKYVGVFQPADGNTSYEELDCVGYDQQTDTLAGIIRVKKPNGYSGGPCTAGSTEYVTFWADTNNNGTFETCLGTASVRVYDYQKIPPEGLEYSVFLPADLLKYRKPCKEGPRIIPIRAILSWQTAAPCGNPDYVPVWGNREETAVLVEPGDVFHPGEAYPFVSSVGQMATNKIDSAGYATGVSVNLGFTASMSPFGGRIDIAGKIVNGLSSSKYRVLIKPHGASDSSYVPLTNEPTGLSLSVVTPPFINTVTIHADGLGYYDYQDYSSSHFVDGNILMRWQTGVVENGNTYDLRLDLSTDGNPAHDLHSVVIALKIDNQAPAADLSFNMGMNVLCSKGSPGMILTGNFTAQDQHFHSYSFAIYPNDASLNVQYPTPSSGVSVYYGGAIGDPGAPPAVSAFTLNTTGMAPCGYALILRVYDRTIVNSAFIGNYAEDSVGFCLA